ncbi:MAG: DUF86 domain-containing protein [Proteobacteria bacterium]|nr:DUF86 domain-containing protein [Pseudomonadota bacterium]MBU1736651.1 DUF86 domain-containing protein [Pseudomonadota bacterium]
MSRQAAQLSYIRECIEKIESYTRDLDYSGFCETPLIQDAVLRNLQIMTESTQRLSESFRKNHPDVEWRKISGLRNILVHDYLGIDLETVWNILAGDLQDLKKVLPAP